MADANDIVARLLDDMIEPAGFPYRAKSRPELCAEREEAAARIQSDAATIAALREALGDLLGSADGSNNIGLPDAFDRARQALRSDA